MALVNLELNASRVATSAKLRNEFEKRADDNSEAVRILHDNCQMWTSVGGPSPDVLFRPDQQKIETANRCCETLRKMAETETRDGLAEFAEEISKAVDKLRSVEWEDIRKEKYFLTPPALFTELVRTATSLISRQAAEIARRQQWLAEVPEMAANESRNVPLKQGSVDKYGIALEEFKMKTGKKPRDWKKAVKIAGWFPSNRHVHVT